MTTKMKSGIRVRAIAAGVLGASGVVASEATAASVRRVSTAGNLRNRKEST